jgi:hypothetical protein
MDRAEARTLLLEDSAKYRTKSYADLSALVGRPRTYEVKGASGVVYQLELQAFWDDKPNDVLRVRLAIDDGGIRAYMPLSEDFLIAPDGHFVGE